jgi:hypothetical protein
LLAELFIKHSGKLRFSLTLSISLETVTGAHKAYLQVYEVLEQLSLPEQVCKPLHGIRKLSLVNDFPSAVE